MEVSGQLHFLPLHSREIGITYVSFSLEACMWLKFKMYKKPVLVWRVAEPYKLYCVSSIVRSYVQDYGMDGLLLVWVMFLTFAEPFYHLASHSTLDLVMLKLYLCIFILTQAVISAL
jgi:hypothetical protein